MILQGQVAFITAAGSGIGRAGAIAMAREGATVIVTDLDGTLAQQTAAMAGPNARALQLDVTDDQALTAAITALPRLDILHSNAGLQTSGTLLQATAADMDRSWALNVRAHFIAARAAVPLMQAARKGSIILTASNSGVQIDRGMIAYATTKHATIAMAKQIAADYAADNIRCNALCPGFVDTPFNAGFETQMGGRKGLDHYIETNIPMRRWATLGEIAEAILYLASPRSGFMTGHALVLDGGESL